MEWTREGRGDDITYVGRVAGQEIAKIYRGGDRYYPWSISMPTYRIGNASTLATARDAVQRAYAAAREGI